jgi:hypothetical protein
MLPNAGKNLPVAEAGVILRDYASVVAIALKQEVGNSRRSVKTLMRWTGAGERTVKNWLGAVRGPSGAHLVALVGHSSSVHFALLTLSGRVESRTTNIDAATRLIRNALTLLQEEGAPP